MLTLNMNRNFVTYYSAIVILQCPAGDPSNRSAVITDVVTVNTRVISLENTTSVRMDQIEFRKKDQCSNLNWNDPQ